MITGPQASFIRPSDAEGPRAEQGSITPLAVGFAALGLSLVILATVISDIYLAHRKLYAIADSAALSAAESYEPGQTSEPSIRYAAHDVDAKARRFVSRAPLSDRWSGIEVDSYASDAQTVTVRISARYSPALLSPFVPSGIRFEAEADVRGALRRG